MDLGRFLRLCISVFDPDPGYGPMKCGGDGTVLPKGCGEVALFHTAMHNHMPMGYQCKNCGAIYPWAFTKSISKLPSRIVLISDGTATIGTCRSESDSGVVVTDS